MILENERICIGFYDNLELLIDDDNLQDTETEDEKELLENKIL